MAPVRRRHPAVLVLVLGYRPISGQVCILPASLALRCVRPCLRPAVARGFIDWMLSSLRVFLVLLFGAYRPELANFEALEVVPEQSLQDQFNALDAELLTKVPAQPQQLWEGQEDGYEPYSDEMDAYVTYSGMPHPLDDDLFRHNRYEFWKANYKRIPNEKPVSWSYDGPDSDPDLWSSLKKEYSQCDPDLTGSMSSPIDIPVGRAVDKCYGPSFPLKEGAEWDSTDATIQESFDRSFILDVMHCTQACKICKADCSEAPTVKKTIEHPAAVLDRVIFHTPSEHKLDGEKLDMEIQVRTTLSHRLQCSGLTLRTVVPAHALRQGRELPHHAVRSQVCDRGHVPRRRRPAEEPEGKQPQTQPQIRGRQTDRQTDRHEDAQRHSHADKQSTHAKNSLHAFAHATFTPDLHCCARSGSTISSPRSSRSARVSCPPSAPLSAQN
eukprot:3774597-Rhodomonas_salina.2